MRLHALAAAVVGVLPLLGTPQAATAQVRLQGTVADSATGLPIVAARVQLVQLHRVTQTHEDGRFDFGFVAPGVYTVAVQRLGYRSVERRVQLDTQPSDTRIRLAPAAVELGAIRVVTGALGDRGDEILSPSSALSGAELDRKLGGTLAATLAAEPGVTVSALSPSTARPVIRGLSGDRIVILEDGQRPGDLSAMSADHATSIDPLTAERLEVVRGPMSLLFGASALGGVVNVIRDEVPRSEVEGVHGTLSLQGSSVNDGGAIGGVVTAGRGRWATRLESSLRGGGDTRTPVGLLDNTGVRERAGAVGISYVVSRGHIGIAWRGHANDYGIPGGFVGGHTTGVDIEMRRRTLRLDGELHAGHPALHDVRLTTVFSDYGHSELQSDGGVGTRFDQRSFTTELVARHEAVGPLSQGAFGLRFQGTDFRTGGSLATPSTRSWGAAGFAVEELRAGPFGLQAGARYEIARLQPQEESFIDVGGVRIPTRPRSFASLAGSLGATWAPRESMRLGVSLQRAFRVPDVTELYSNGPHLAANSFDVGDPTLDAETGIAADAFLRWSTPSLNGELAVFRSQLTNYVFPSSRGRAELGSQGGRPRFQYTNEDVRFHGAEGRLEWSPMPQLAFSGTVSVVQARFVSTRDSIPVITPTSTTFIAASDHPPFIPPVIGSVAARFDRTRWLVSAESRFAGSQRRTGDFETPTAGWWVPGLSTGLRLVRGSHLHAITLRIDNAFDRTYREHLSRIKEIRPEAGRNVSLLYRLSL